MTARDEKSRGVGASGSAATFAEITANTEACNLQSPDKSPQPIGLSPAGTLFSPAESLAWVLGLLAVGACIAPWLARGWLWLEMIAAAMGLLACYDALALWRSRGEFAPVLLPAEKGLGGREGQTIQVPLALTGSGRRGPHSEVRAAIMPATEESETAMRVRGGPQRLKLELPSLDGGSVPVNRAPILLWSWTPEIALLRRGLWPGPRVGIERRSRFGIWRLRQWLDSAAAPQSDIPQARAPRRLLDLAVETALVGATVALELGDEFGLVTYADEPKSWLRAGSGQSQFRRFRDRLLSLEPLPTTADY